MARITTVAKAKASKRTRTCIRCHQPIEVGQSYQHVQANRYAPKLNKHTDCAPSFKQSEMTSSKMATAYAGQEDAHDALDALDIDSYRTDDEQVFDADAFMLDVAGALEAASEGASECASDYQDGLDAMPEGLQYGSVGEEMSEKIDALESYQSDVESFDYTGDAWSDVYAEVVGEHADDDDDEEDADEKDARDLDDADEPMSEELLDALADAWSDWTAGVLEEAREVVDALDI